MNDNTHDPSAPASEPRAARGRRSWLSPGGQGQWWSPSPSEMRIVEQDTHPRTHQSPEHGRQVPLLDGERGPSFFQRAQSVLEEQVHAATGSGTRARWQDIVWRVATSTPAVMVYLILLLLLVIQVMTHVPWASLAGTGQHHSQGSHPQVVVTPTRTPLPTPTATPTQTELDGVITIQNLDSDVTFEGDVQVLADHGRLFCRNAPLADSKWHIVLAGGATTTVPCIIPVSSPSTLATHTFTTVEAGQNGRGRVLVDNLSPFQGTAYFPTATTNP